MRPNIPWIVRHRVLRPEYRYYWLRGTVERDGFKWTTRGLKDGHYAYKEYEPYLRSYLLSGGHVFVDVGAHVGTWTVRASRVFDKVVAFEPTVETVRVLEKNLNLNSVTNVTVENVALGDGEGWGVMHKFFSISGGGNTLLARHPSFPNRTGEYVNKTDIRKLDSYNLSPDVIKIDTEGYELRVLEGAKKTLESTGKVVVEIHAEENLGRATSLLEENRFKTFIVEDPSKIWPRWLIGEQS